MQSCGFRPLYGNTNTFAGGTTVLDNVWIGTIDNATGLDLRNLLIDRFYNNGTPQNPPYVLNIKLVTSERELAIRKNDTTTRAQIVIRALYTLTTKDRTQTVDKGEIRSIASYDVLESQYTTQVTQGEAQQLALQDLADKMTLRISVVLEQKMPTTTSTTPQLSAPDVATAFPGTNAAP